MSPPAPQTISTRRSGTYSSEVSEALDIAVASTMPASLMLELPPSMCVLVAVLRTRAAQAVARDCLHTLEMRQSVDITFYYPGSTRCWAQITAAQSPLRMEDLQAGLSSRLLMSRWLRFER